MTKRNLFDELMEGVDALKAERQGNITLKQVLPKQHHLPHGGELKTGVEQTQLPCRITDTAG